MYTQQSPTNTTTTSQQQSASISDTLLSDVGLASLVGAFTIPVAGALGVVVSPIVLGLQTALGATGAGITFMYPQAFNSVSAGIKNIPTWLIAAIVIGGGAAVVAGTYYANKQWGKKHGW